ncbi:Hypothetical predicted protein [Mytilus galloprovincialis]|uniref:Uncharacterized protein n=1 Tax=Mytilus galloprovincialis TaxID=29158 RepID=A0A8B6GL86_MYTGA|nr:Hypothetical predicted protein [Mytilus galloprovincialis]
MLVYDHIGESLLLNSCPENIMWNLRAKNLCGDKNKYMCLYDTNERKFRELCKDKPDFHRSGNIFVISGNLQYFAGRSCYSNRYQPHKWWTNGSSDCQYLKSMCNGEGQVPFDNGTISRDRKCRCDYTNYYTFLNNSTMNRCHCDPTEEDCSCYIKKCKIDEVLTPDYDCVNVHAWTGVFVCPEHKASTFTKEKIQPRRTTVCPLYIRAREIMKNELVEINEKMADLDDFLETHGKRQQRKVLKLYFLRYKLVVLAMLKQCKIVDPELPSTSSISADFDSKECIFWQEQIKENSQWPANSKRSDLDVGAGYKTLQTN